jgi:HEAT repeat protein
MRAALFAALFAITSAPAVAADKPEPKYEGKPLDYWLTRFQKAENEKDRDAAAAALKAFGPDAAPAVPAFIEMLADHSPEYRQRVIGIIGAIGPKAKDARPVIAKLVKDKKTTAWDGSIEAIVALSPDPKEAVPLLAPLLEITEHSYEVYHALCDIGPGAKDAIPAVRKYVLRELAEVQKAEKKSLYGLEELSKLGPDVVPLLVEMLDTHGGIGRVAAFGCLQKLGPKATDAAPALVKLLKHDDPATRLRAASVLWKVEKDPAAVATLTELVKLDPGIYYVTNPGYEPSWRASIAGDAARSLGEIGPAAKDALPALKLLMSKKEGPGVSVEPAVILPVGADSKPRTAQEAAAEAVRKIEGKTGK